MTFWDPSESPWSWIRLSSKSSATVWFLSLFCKFSVVAQIYLLICWYRDGLKLLIWTRSSVLMELRFKNRKTEELQTAFLLPYTRYPLNSSNRHLSTSGPLNISQTALLSVCGCSSQLLCVRREIPFGFSRLTFVLLATLLFSSPSTKTKNVLLHFATILFSLLFSSATNTLLKFLFWETKTFPPLVFFHQGTSCQPAPCWACLCSSFQAIEVCFSKNTYDHLLILHYPDPHSPIAFGVYLSW